MNAKAMADVVDVLLRKHAQDSNRLKLLEGLKVEIMKSQTEKPRMYDSVRWRKARARHLSEHPLCVLCERQGRETVASVVDHIVEHKGDYDTFWDPDNWQSLCPSCHSGIKRVQENRGYSQAVDVDGIPIDPNHPWNQ